MIFLLRKENRKYLVLETENHQIEIGGQLLNSEEKFFNIFKFLEHKIHYKVYI